MDFNGMIQSISHQATPVNVTLFILLIVSEILGANDNVKASSIYGLVKAILMTIRDQVFPVSKPTA